MDITSFSLGISFVVVVGMLAVTVYNLFRVYKINKEIEDINQSARVTNELLFRAIEENKTIATTENETLWREIRSIHSDTTDSVKELHSSINSNRMWIEKHYDSKIDKLIHRLDRLEREHLGKSTEKQLLND
jgi:hypothetical protein